MGTIGWMGNFCYVMEVDNVGNLRVLPGINHYSSDYTLAPNTVFRTADFIFTLSEEGVGEGSRSLHDWARRYQVHDGMGDRMTLLNNWENTYFSFDKKTLALLIAEITKAEKQGEPVVLQVVAPNPSPFFCPNERSGIADYPHVSQICIRYVLDISAEGAIKS